MAEKYGVLVVDDSAFMRKTIGMMIDASEDFYVIGKARNGNDAIDKIKRLKPSIVTLDIEMPELNGLDTLRTVMEEMPVPIVMLSNGSDSTIEAFELGAVDFVVKEQLIKDVTREAVEDFYKRLLVAVHAKLPKPILKEEAPHTMNKEGSAPDTAGSYLDIDRDKQLLVIGSSTGGPSALQTILTRFPENFPVPVIVIQHMPPGFTRPLAERFDALCKLRVKEAEHDEMLKAGTVYIAPAGLQTTIRQIQPGEYLVRLKVGSPIDTLYKPSVDVTLLSIADKVKSALLTVVLTGMGDDGLRGCKSVKKNGGMVIAEAEESCIVYGMPKVIAEAGLADRQVPLKGMYGEIIAAMRTESGNQEAGRY